MSCGAGNECTGQGACTACSANFCQVNGHASGDFCNGTALVSCSVAGACFVASEMQCPETCSGDMCACLDACSFAGQTRCTSGTSSSQDVCGNYDADTCLEWKTEMCTSGLCSGTACAISCSTRYSQGFESVTLNDAVYGSQNLSDGTAFWDAQGNATTASYVRLTTSSMVGAQAMNIIPRTPGPASNTTLAMAAPATAAETLTVSFWIYNGSLSAYDLVLARAGATPVTISVPGDQWTRITRTISSSTMSNSIVLQFGNAPADTLQRLDDIVVEVCP